MAQTNPASAVADITRNTELWDKIKFTFLCLVLYRLGSHITAPGIDVVALTDFFANKGGGGLLGLYDLFVGGGLSRATVFALGIMPYISASIFIQIAGAVLPQVEKMQKDEEGRKTVNQWTRYITDCPRRSSGMGLRVVYVVASERGHHTWFRVQAADGSVPYHGRDLRHVARRADH